MKIWLGVLSVIVVLQWIKIYSLQDEIERIKSWYPFIRLCKMRTKTFPRKNIKVKEKEEDKDNGETNRT